MADIAGKQSRAAQLREELTVLRVQHTHDMTEASEAAHEAALDREIADLEMQVALEKKKAESGGSVIDAMEAMAAAAAAEGENIVLTEVVDTSDSETGEAAVATESTEGDVAVVTEPAREEEQPVLGLGLVGGNQ